MFPWQPNSARYIFLILIIVCFQGKKMAYLPCSMPFCSFAVCFLRLSRLAKINFRADFFFYTRFNLPLLPLLRGISRHGGSLSYQKGETIDHFTVVCSVVWPLNGSEAGGDLVLIKTSLSLLCRSSYSYAN